MQLQWILYHHRWYYRTTSSSTVPTIEQGGPLLFFSSAPSFPTHPNFSSSISTIQMSYLPLDLSIILLQYYCSFKYLHTSKKQDETEKKGLYVTYPSYHIPQKSIVIQLSHAGLSQIWLTWLDYHPATYSFVPLSFIHPCLMLLNAYHITILVDSYYIPRYLLPISLPVCAYHVSTPTVLPGPEPRGLHMARHLLRNPIPSLSFFVR